MAGDGDKKKNDPTVPIVIGIGILLFVLLFGGCGQISLPTINTGSGNPNPPQCDSRRSDCRGHYDGNGRWVPDQNAGGNQRHRSDHQRRKPRPSDDSDHSGDR